MVTQDPTGQGSDPQSIEASARINGVLTRHMPQIAALTVRGGGVISSFAVTYLLGRYFGAAATGQFGLMMQTAMFLAVLGLMGLDVSVVRHFAKTIPQKQTIALGAFGKVLGISALLLCSIVALIAVGGEWIWRLLFSDVVAIALLPLLCVLVLLRGAVQLLGGLLRSQHRFVLGMAVPSLFIPVAAAFALFSGYAASVEGALWGASFGGVVAIILALLFLTSHIGRGPDSVAIPMRSVMASSLPLWGSVLTLVIGEWYGLAVAAQILGADASGLFRVSFQIAASVQIISSALAAVYSAQISTAFHSGDRLQVAQLARSAVLLSLGFAVPLAALILLSGSFLLGQIGEEFLAASPLLYVLVIGQVLIAFTGPSGLVLAMSGNERINLVISLIGITVLLALAPFAAHNLGLIGIGLSLSGVLVARNLAALIIVRRKLRINIWTGTAR